jgi:hypothetical protein
MKDTLRIVVWAIRTVSRGDPGSPEGYSDQEVIMRSHPARIWLAALLTCTAYVTVAPAAQAAFGVEEKNFEAGTCNVRDCEYSSPHSEFFTQAAGHPEWGITGFELNSTGGVPEGKLKRIRVDVPPGLAADPQAPTPTCSETQFESDAKLCPSSSLVGEVEMKALVELVPGLPTALPALTGQVYNLPLEPGRPLLFGVTVEPLAPLVAPVKLTLVGHLSDAYEPELAARSVPSGDYHEYFEIDNVPTEGEVGIGGIKAPLRVLKSKLLFKGRAGGNFLTLPSVCSSSTTSYLEVESYEGQVSSTPTHTPVGVEGCEKVPFNPTTTVTPETSTSDEPDGVTADVHAPQYAEPEQVNTADIQDAHVTLPEGITLNPPAANGLGTCSPEQIGIGSAHPVECPAASKIGAVAIETDLPPHSLMGNVYLGDPAGGPITGPPFAIYIDAESIYGVSVRLQGLVEANRETGRLEATFTANPPLPFEDLKLTLGGGPRAPLANPLVCGEARTESLFTPYTGGTEALSSTPFTTTGCPQPLPLSLTQSTQDSSPDAGAYTSYTFNLARADGQQYLSQVTTTLPAGLLGAIPSVPLCGEPQAAVGTCPPAAEIGTAAVTAGAGPEPYAFAGEVYLTGPYAGAPYGLSIVVPALAGPFDLGQVVTRAQVNVAPYTGRVVVTASLPRIVGGVPLRLRSIAVDVNRPSFLFNPTNCGPLATESTLTGFVPGSSATATQSLSTPFEVGGCEKLPFSPKLTASTRAKTSRAKGASLEVKLTQGTGQANIRQVIATLPKQLPSRLTTLHGACPAATFEVANPPGACPEASRVGSATATTPVLPGKLEGPAYLVSHGGAAFPDLDVILRGDGVTVVLVAHTHISSAGVTSSTFESLPDVPVSSFTLSLPTGPHSLLAAHGGLCWPISDRSALKMPATIVAQSGAKLTLSTKIAVRSCPRLRHKKHSRRHRRRRGARTHHTRRRR